jgi:hypothetical protein
MAPELSVSCCVAPMKRTGELVSHCGVAVAMLPAATTNRPLAPLLPVAVAAYGSHATPAPLEELLEPDPDDEELDAPEEDEDEDELPMAPEEELLELEEPELLLEELDELEPEELPDEELWTLGGLDEPPPQPANIIASTRLPASHGQCRTVMGPWRDANGGKLVLWILGIMRSPQAAVGIELPNRMRDLFSALPATRQFVKVAGYCLKAHTVRLTRRTVSLRIEPGAAAVQVHLRATKHAARLLDLLSSTARTPVSGSAAHGC